jgi:hypothetical protein
MTPWSAPTCRRFGRRRRRSRVPAYFVLLVDPFSCRLPLPNAPVRNAATVSPGGAQTLVALFS